MAKHLYPIQITANQTLQLKAYLLSNQATDNYWTDAWNTYKGDVTNAANKNIVFTRLQGMLKFMMSSMSEYQLS